MGEEGGEEGETNEPNPDPNFLFSLPALSRFDSEPDDQTVFLGQTAVFECSTASSIPPTRPKWLKDDYPLDLDHRMTVLPSGMLTVTDVTLADRAEYRCVAEAADGKEKKRSKSASLKLNLDMGKWISMPSSWENWR